MPNPHLDFAGDYNLDKIEIITATNEVLPLRMGVIMELNIYEDIEKNALTGSMAILDANNIISNTPLQGNERVVFRLSTPGTEGNEQIIDASEETGYPFHIYAITDRKILSETLMSYNIHFCSRELMRNARTRVSRAYDGGLHQAAIKILRDETGLDSKKKFYYEQTRNKDKIVIPNMRPLSAMNLLSEKALSKNANGAGYYFYETTKGFHFRSYESMLAGQGKFARPSVTVLRYQPKTFFSAHERTNYNMHNIDSYEIMQHFDTLSQQMMGTYASRVITYNFYDKAYQIADYNYHDEYAQHFHADTLGSTYKSNFPITNAPVDKEQKIKGTEDRGVSDYPHSHVILQPSTRYLHGDDTGSFGTSTDNEGKTEAIRNSQENQVNNSTRVKVVMPGHSYVQAGDIVEFQLPSLERNKGEKAGYAYDDKHSGRYLVAKCRHRLIKQEYKMILELVKDTVYNPHEKGPRNYQGKEETNRGSTDIYSQDKSTSINPDNPTRL